MKKGKTPLFCNKKAIIPIFFVSILWFLYGGKRWIRIRARASVLARIAKRPAPKGGSWRNAPRGVNRAESTIPSIKKRHRDFSKEVDSLGVGQFSNIQQNAALCSAMLSKVHNGAVAIRNGANRGLRTRYLIHSLSQKKAVSRLRYCFFLVGRGGFEPPKAVPTDLQSAPFGHSGIFPYGAGGRSRTNNLLITNQLLCH